MNKWRPAGETIRDIMAGKKVIDVAFYNDPLYGEVIDSISLDNGVVVHLSGAYGGIAYANCVNFPEDEEDA